MVLESRNNRGLNTKDLIIDERKKVVDFGPPWKISSEDLKHLKETVNSSYITSTDESLKVLASIFAVAPGIVDNLEARGDEETINSRFHTLSERIKNLSEGDLKIAIPLAAASKLAFLDRYNEVTINGQDPFELSTEILLILMMHITATEQVKEEDTYSIMFDSKILFPDQIVNDNEDDISDTREKLKAMSEEHISSLDAESLSKFLILAGQIKFLYPEINLAILQNQIKNAKNNLWSLSYSHPSEFYKAILPVAIIDSEEFNFDRDGFKFKFREYNISEHIQPVPVDRSF